MSLWNGTNILDAVNEVTGTAADLVKNGVPVRIIIDEQTILKILLSGIAIAFCATIFQFGIAKLFGKNGGS